MAETFAAEITGVFGAYFWVRLCSSELPYDIHPIFWDNHRAVLTAKPSGRLRLMAEPNLQKGEHLLSVGDRVQVLLNPGSGEEIMASIVALEERRNYIQRGAPDRVQTLAANVDLVLVIASVDQPAFNSGFIDRVLCEAELSGVRTAIIVNKADLLPGCTPAHQADVVSNIELYQKIGYSCFLESFTVQGISQPLSAMIAALRVLLIGQSGVGKSTFLNLKVGQNIQRTQEISAVKKGRHTTVNPVLYSMPDGTEIIDVPGLREFGLQHLRQTDIRFGFREFLRFRCRFDNCLHLSEPGCNVRAAVSGGELSEKRYQSYLAILESLHENFKPRKGDYWRGIRK